MSDDWNTYYKTQPTEMRSYIPGEDLTGVSVEPGYTPKEGDMIARDPKKPTSFWLVSEEFFEANYESE